MKRLFLDCQMGIAGDMLTATLLGLVDNPQTWINQLNQMGIPDVTYSLISKEDKGVEGYRVVVTINGIEESENHKGSPNDQYYGDHHNSIIIMIITIMVLIINTTNIMRYIRMESMLIVKSIFMVEVYRR